MYTHLVWLAIITKTKHATHILLELVSLLEREREREGETQTDRQTQSERQRQREREIEPETDR